MAETVRREIEQRAAEFGSAFNGGDMAALAALYTEDATLMPPDSHAISGRPAIERFWQGMRDSGVARIALHPQRVDASGDTATDVGTADLTLGSETGPGGTVPLKYVVVWRRPAGGPWQLAVDIWNGRPAE